MGASALKSCQQAGEANHPGILLRDVVFPALSLSVSHAAKDLCVTRQTLHRILAGRAAISPDMAVRLQKLCGVPWQFWLERQHAHELRHIFDENHDLFPRIPSRLLPAAIMKQIGAPNGG